MGVASPCAKVVVDLGRGHSADNAVGSIAERQRHGAVIALRPLVEALLEELNVRQQRAGINHSHGDTRDAHQRHILGERTVGAGMPVEIETAGVRIDTGVESTVIHARVGNPANRPVTESAGFRAWVQEQISRDIGSVETTG